MTLNNPTYILATEGINSSNTFSIATRGYTFDIFITPIPPPPTRPAGGSTGVSVGKPEEEEYRNKVLVRVTIDGRVYEEEVLTKLTKVSASNVHVDIVGDEEKPKLKVEVY